MKHDLTGKTFGLLTVIGKADIIILSRNAFWKCVCACGATAYVSHTHLVRGYATSCGCDQESSKR